MLNFTMADFEMPKLEGDIFAQLQREEAKKAELEANVTAIEIAPRTLAEVEAAIKKKVARLAAAGRPDLSDLSRGFSMRERTGEYRVANPNAKIEFAETAFAEIMLPGAEPLSMADPVRLIAWLFPQQMESRLLELARKSERPGAISEAEKPARLAEAKRKLLFQERIVEALAVECERRGALIPRIGPKPWVLLGVEPTRTPAA